MATIRHDEAKRLAIYCFYDGKGRAASFIDVFLADLMKNVTDLVVVVNGKINTQAERMFRAYTNRIIVRENIGLDVAAYRQGMLEVGWDKLAEYDEVICLNDTVLGPVYSFEEMFTRMDAKNLDFWGITAYPAETVNGEDIPTHLQAYWHAYRRRLVCSDAFHSYWQNMPVWKSYAEVTREHEMKVTHRFEQLGFTWESYVDYRQFEHLTPYALLYTPMEAVRDARCPVFKRRSFFLDYDVYFDQTAGQPAMELFDYLRNHTDYDTDLIWDAVLPNYNIADIAKAMHLDYVLPAASLSNRTRPAPKSAFIFHIYFMDMLADTFRYIGMLPDSTDLYITTTEDKIETIRTFARERGVNRPITFIPVLNRGRDVSALLVGAKDVVLNGGYEVIGFAHDKKSSQNQELGHHGTETQGFTYKLMENTLGSRDYVENVLTLFADNPRLGLACPPPPFHALYFAHTLPLDWTVDFELTKELLNQHLNISVPLDKNKPTRSAMGSCYWFRVDALKPLFEYGWTYTDFLPEREMKPDGTISHAIERANGYIAQSQGYYPVWVMSDRYARIEVDSLYYVTGKLLNAVLPARRGETILANSQYVHYAVMRHGRIYRFVRRRIHLALKAVAKYTIKPLPEPVRRVIYTAVWTPIAIMRTVANKLRERILPNQ